MIIDIWDPLREELEPTSEYFRRTDFKLTEKITTNTNIRMKLYIKKFPSLGRFKKKLK